MSAPSSQKQKRKGGPRASGDGKSDDRAHRCRRHRGAASAAAASFSSTSPSCFPLLSLSLLLLLPLSSLMLAAAQQQPQVDPAVVEAIGAATLAGESNAAFGEANGAAFSSATSTNSSSDPAAAAAAEPTIAAAALTQAERDARLDRVLSFLSAGNIFVGNYQPYQRVIRRRVEQWVECRYQSSFESRNKKNS